MKKSTKSAKPAAPQVKSVVPKPVEPKPVKKTVAPRKKAASKAPPAAEGPAPVPPTTIVAPTPAHAKVSGAATTITARIDIGFGNALYIRGEGPGLSWDRGVAMDCAADDLWSVTLPEGEGQVIFKFLVNDLSWSAGSDYVLAAGKNVELTPSF